MDEEAVRAILEQIYQHEQESQKSSEQMHSRAWARVIERNSSPKLLKVVEMFVANHKSEINYLANGTDEFGRRYIDIASAECRDIINRVLHLHEEM